MTGSCAIRWTVDELLPHAAPMILIDEVMDFRGSALSAQVLISEDSVFYRDFEGVPSWVGVEYMAQTIAAMAGVRAKNENRPVKVGYLVGTRRYSCTTPLFALGHRLTIHVQEVFEEGGMGVFDCEIISDQAETLVSARLNVYLPRSEQG